MSKIIGNNLPDMPWQEKPAGEHMPVWRYDQNPIMLYAACNVVCQRLIDQCKSCCYNHGRDTEFYIKHTV